MKQDRRCPQVAAVLLLPEGPGKFSPAIPVPLAERGAVCVSLLRFLRRARPSGVTIWTIFRLRGTGARGVRGAIRGLTLDGKK